MGEVAGFSRVVGKGLAEKVAFGQKEVREAAGRGRAFQAAGTAKAKAQKCSRSSAEAGGVEGRE